MITRYLVYSINVLIFFAILLLPPDAASYLKCFTGIVLLYNIPGFLLLRVTGLFKKEQPFYSTFILSLVTGFSLWLVPLFITSQFKIPIPSIAIYVITTICTIIFLYTIYKDFKKKTFLKITKIDTIMLILFNILLFVYITPLKGLLVAPLHDPAAISVYAKKLMENRYILSNLAHSHSFYPPGGYFLVGLVADVIQLDPSKATMIMTNLFNVFIGFSFATLMSKLFKGKNIAWISVFVYSFLSIFPALLYFTEGKNAQIMAFVFLFASLYFFYESIGNKIFFKLLFGLTLISSVLLHYNTLLITLVFCIAIYIYKIVKEKYKAKIILKDILTWTSILLIVGTVFYLQLQTLKNVSYFQNSILRPLDEDERFQGIIGLTDFFEWFVPYNSSSINTTNSIVVLALGLFSYSVLLIKFGYDLIKKKTFNKEFLFLFLFLLFFYGALYIELGAVTRYFHYNKLIIFLIPISFIIGMLFDRDIKLFKHLRLNYLLILLFLLVGAYNMKTLYRHYIEVRFVSPVKQEDLKAFEWMNENIPKGSYIIPAHIQNKYGYVLDASLYMKAFTDNYELFAFVYGERLENERVLKNTYLSLGENPTDISLLENFTSSNIYYIFSGSYTPWGCGELPCGFFDNYPERYEVIYDLDGVRIYKITK